MSICSATATERRVDRPLAERSENREERRKSALRAAGGIGYSVYIPRYTYTNVKRSTQSILTEHGSHGIDGRAQPAACCGPPRVAEQKEG